jgi:hypothetical protein
MARKPDNQHFVAVVSRNDHESRRAALRRKTVAAQTLAPVIEAMRRNGLAPHDLRFCAALTSEFTWFKDCPYRGNPEHVDCMRIARERIRETVDLLSVPSAGLLARMDYDLFISLLGDPAVCNASSSSFAIL